MRFLISTILAGALLCLAPTASWADLAPYSQDFEGLDQADPAALANDPQPFPNGWLVYGNVFGPHPNWWHWYGYGAFPAPNHDYGFSSITSGEGGPAQGDQQLNIYSDYNNGDHAAAWIESNVFQQREIGAADVGSTWRFEFDAKRGNIELDSTAAAFIKTLNPAAGWVTTNNLQEPMTYIPDTWDTYKIDIYIDPSLEGQVLQFGFVNWAAFYRGSAIFYDNVSFDLAPLGVSLDLRPEGCPNPINSRSPGLYTAAVLGTMDLDVSLIDIASLRLEGVAPVHTSYEDLGTPFEGDLCGCNAAGPDGFDDLTLKFDVQDLVAASGMSGNGYQALTLTGTLLDGTEIEGQDCLLFVGGRRTQVRSVDRATTRSRQVGVDNPDGVNHLRKD